MSTLNRREMIQMSAACGLGAVIGEAECSEQAVAAEPPLAQATTGKAPIRTRMFWTWDHSTEWALNRPGAHTHGSCNEYGRSTEAFLQDYTALLRWCGRHTRCPVREASIRPAPRDVRIRTSSRSRWPGSSSYFMKNGEVTPAWTAAGRVSNANHRHVMRSHLATSWFGNRGELAVDWIANLVQRSLAAGFEGISLFGEVSLFHAGAELNYLALADYGGADNPTADLESFQQRVAAPLLGGVDIHIKLKS